MFSFNYPGKKIPQSQASERNKNHLDSKKCVSWISLFWSARSLHWRGVQDKAEIARNLYSVLIESHHLAELKTQISFFPSPFFMSQTNFTVSEIGDVLIAPAAPCSLLQRKLLVFNSGSDQVHLYVNVFTALSCTRDKITRRELKEKEEFHFHWFGKAKYLAW